MIKEVVTVGGGSGSPVVNEALLHAGTKHINAIAAVFDSGGATGRRRLDARGQEIAYSDAMRILLSLVSPEQIGTPLYQEIHSLFNHRTDQDKVLGQEIFAAYFNKHKGFDRIKQMLDNLGLNLLGQVFPSTTDSAHIQFVTSHGRKFTGEHHLDDQRMSQDMVVDMYLDRPADAYKPAADALAQAPLIILSAGSLHGSVLSNFLPNGMRAALAANKGKLFVVSNLTSVRNETHEITPIRYAEIIEQYTGRRPDGVIVPELTRKEFESRHTGIAALYASEHSHFLGWETDELYKAQAAGLQIVTHAATTIVEGKNIVRHDTKKFSEALTEILS